jgi:hypothetical protein
MTTATATKPRQPRTIKPAHGTARLVLEINGTPYRVRPIAPDPGSGVVRAYRLTKPEGTIYDCARFSTWSECSCPDHVFNRDGLSHGPCKHVAALQVAGLMPAEPTPRWEPDAEGHTADAEDRERQAAFRLATQGR